MCTLMPKLPPTSLQITRTSCSGSPGRRATMSCIMLGAWKGWYTVSRRSDGSKSSRLLHEDRVAAGSRPGRVRVVPLPERGGGQHHVGVTGGGGQEVVLSHEELHPVERGRHLLHVGPWTRPRRRNPTVAPLPAESDLARHRILRSEEH